MRENVIGIEMFTKGNRIFKELKVCLIHSLFFCVEKYEEAYRVKVTPYFDAVFA